MSQRIFRGDVVAWADRRLAVDLPLVYTGDRELAVEQLTAHKYATPAEAIAAVQKVPENAAFGVFRAEGGGYTLEPIRWNGSDSFDDDYLGRWRAGGSVNYFVEGFQERGVRWDAPSLVAIADGMRSISREHPEQRRSRFSDD